MTSTAVDTDLRAPDLRRLPTPDLIAFQARAQQAYGAIKARGLTLDFTRGKPSAEQLDLSNGLFTAIGADDYISEDGGDCRNYFGSPQGLIEARRLFAPILGAPPEQVLVANNSSLALMHDVISYALLTGAKSGGTPWSRQSIAFLCPAPGYDRHFALAEQYGIRLLPVPLTGQGPDMDAVERLVADPLVKGMWCVPKYSNPTAETYSPATVERLARMPTGAEDFRVFWDNAYAVHHLTDQPDELANLLEAAARHGHPDRVFVFASTSKVTFGGGGLGMLAASPANLRWFLERAGKRSIGPDKLNQLRHARFLRDADGIARHMAKHRNLLAPKFAAVREVLVQRLGGAGIAYWSDPRGGYFVDLNVMDGCAKRAVALAVEAGVAMVPAGRTFPYGRDPNDRNIRLAPSFPSVAELRQSTEVVALATMLAASERLLAQRNAR